MIYSLNNILFLSCDFWRYLAARIFMLSGTERQNALFTCMTKAYCDELGAFKSSFYHQNWQFETKNWFDRYDTHFFCTWSCCYIFMRLFSNKFRYKKSVFRIDQINFLFQIVNFGDKIKAWKVHFSDLYLIAWKS